MIYDLNKVPVDVISFLQVQSLHHRHPYLVGLSVLFDSSICLQS